MRTHQCLFVVISFSFYFGFVRLSVSLHFCTFLDFLVFMLLSAHIERFSVSCMLFTIASTLVGPWSSRHPFRGWLIHHITEQTRTNMFQPGRRPGTSIGDEQHFLQALWSRKDILTLRVGHGSVPCWPLFTVSAPWPIQSLSPDIRGWCVVCHVSCHSA